MIIGFADSKQPSKAEAKVSTAKTNCVRASLVKVYFPEYGYEYTYYNNTFDLSEGDIVFVEGKLENIRGVVTQVSYNFKIKPDDFKKIISKADTTVVGEFLSANNYFVSFDKDFLPFDKAASWFMPANKNDGLIYSTDDSQFPLDDFDSLNISKSIWARAKQYFLDNNVKYLSLDKNSAKAIVCGSRAYTVEFEYKDGNISKLVCDCPCVGTCKHEVAVLLTLKQFLDKIKADFSSNFENSNYFCIIDHNEFLSTILRENSQYKFKIS